MYKRPFRLFGLFLLMVLSVCSFPMKPANALTQSTIRVWLRRLNVTDTLRIDVQGAYMLDDGRMTFSDGSEITVVLRGDQLVLHSDGMAVIMGDSIRMNRCEDEKSSALRLNGSGGLYEGDLVLTAEEDVIRPVLHIYIEDYLLGVVPYEMGDGFPLEALKAQAIAARTYALRKSGSSDDYDVEDTTNDQAYKGRSASSPLSEQAVYETAGLCGAYQGNLAWCYYSASNGGQTELGGHVWPSDNPDEYAYMDMRDDPFDLENEASVVKRYTLKKKPGNEGVGTALHHELVSAMAPTLEKLGYEADGNLIRIDEIKKLELKTPKFDEPSRLMTEIDFTLRISAREYTYKDNSPVIDVGTDAVIAPDATPGPTPAPTATPAYSPYKKIKQDISVTLPYFTQAEKAMGLSINVYQNELVSITDIGSAYMIESRRFGHGVGMSQRGAQQMAGKYGMTCEQILKFYYPGMDIMMFGAVREPLPVIDMSIMATPAPTPSPTPRPTLMPVSKDQMPKGAYLAVVSNIDDDSSLNLRQSPSLSAEVLRRLYKDQLLIVLKTDKDGWAKVRTDVIEGYVRSEYLQTAEE